MFKINLLRFISSTKDGKQSRERGTSAIEATLILPLLMVLAGTVLDLGGWINQYFTNSRIAYEGARYASAKDNLQANNDSLVIGRLITLLNKNGIKTASSSLSVTRDTNTNSIEVVVNTTYSPYLFRMEQFSNVRVRVRAPYLLKNS